MKNLVGYIFGFAFCVFLNHLTWSDIAKQDNSGNVFANILFLIGLFCSFCGILVESLKLIGKIILNNLHKSEKD